MNKIYLVLVAASLASGALSPAFAVTSNGTIGATLTLTNGCLINGSPGQNGINFGTLDFGTHPATFSELTTPVNWRGRRQQFWYPVYDRQLHGAGYRKYQRDRTWYYHRNARHASALSDEFSEYQPGCRIPSL
ncbi:Uncharacterised protein [Salmonella enterica subsp. arizonae]|uniref:Fimbrial protein n=1 Tax=Salmonella enterica subsp. arizonae TaxID=59203 RepID=A0A379SV44_SALER|nr:Uncharacterised protein [Salmonella enterica subsp. arizonae]